MVELRFRCPEDVPNTLIHHTKIKFMENAAAKQTHANVSRRESLKDGYPEKVLGNWLVQGKSSSLGVRGGDRHRNTYQNQWDRVSRKRESRRKSRRKSGEKVANSIDVLPYEEHRLETECGRQWLFEEYFGEDMMARGFSHCTKVMARSGTAWGMWMVGGPVELRHRMSLQWTALSMRSLKNGKRSGEPKCGPTLRRSEASVEKCTPTSTPTTLVCWTGCLGEDRSMSARRSRMPTCRKGFGRSKKEATEKGVSFDEQDDARKGEADGLRNMEC